MRILCAENAAPEIATHARTLAANRIAMIVVFRVPMMSGSGLSPRARQRLDHVLPALLDAGGFDPGLGAAEKRQALHPRSDRRLVIPGAPVAAFSGTPVSGTAPLAVAFSDASTGSPTVAATGTPSARRRAALLWLRRRRARGSPVRDGAATPAASKQR